ncbi:MAG: flagellar type III secretion system pore protein FliP [Oscillospiraceae bacterium]|nr:flagellar type III secretion system pore protein FliP [Oscillospiraceae bacterium]
MKVFKIARFFVFFAVIALFVSMLTMTVTSAPGETGLMADAANEGVELAPEPESSALNDLIGVDGSQPLEILLLITILSVAPSILLMMTSFTRIIIVFGFLRNAMSTQSTPPNQVLTGLALFLTMFIMWPVFAQINDEAYRPYVNGEYTAWEAVEEAGKPLKTFMLRQTTPANMRFFMDLADATLFDLDEEGNQIPILPTGEVNYLNYQEQLSLRVVIPSFMISELSRAFQMGFLLFIPFLIIDMVVASTLMSMGMMMLPPAMISLPFKIMLFVLVDGWQMLVGAIVTSFRYG